MDGLMNDPETAAGPREAAEAPVPAEPVAEEPAITARIVRGLDDIQKVFALRAAVYMAEQDCPYEEEYDGNDFAGATHILAERDGEPVGCLRIRWFNDFAKIERVAVRKSGRSGRAARLMMELAIETLRRKGYRRLLGQVQEHLLPYWRRYGLVHREHRGRFVFSERAYVEVEGRFEPHPKAVTMESPPLVIDRPEGDWDRPGPLDRSAARPAKPDAAAAARRPRRAARPPKEAEPVAAATPARRAAR